MAIQVLNTALQVKTKQVTMIHSLSTSIPYFGDEIQRWCLDHCYYLKELLWFAIVFKIINLYLNLHLQNFCVSKCRLSKIWEKNGRSDKSWPTGMLRCLIIMY